MPMLKIPTKLTKTQSHCVFAYVKMIQSHTM